MEYGELLLRGAMMMLLAGLAFGMLISFVEMLPSLVSNLMSFLRLILWQSMSLLWMIVRAAFRWMEPGFRRSKTQDDHTGDQGRDERRESFKRETAEPERPQARSAFEEACFQLGLRLDHSKTEFRAAFRTAIMATHPDHGGRTEDAQRVNMAADVIRAARGWT